MHDLTFRILAVLHDGPADGQTILRRLRDPRGTANNPSLPTLYRRLRNGLTEGWIEIATVRDDATPGRPPQTYRMTASGAEAVERAARRHRELAALVLKSGPAGRIGGR